MIWSVRYRPQTNLREDNVFSCVSLSVQGVAQQVIGPCPQTYSNFVQLGRHCTGPLSSGCIETCSLWGTDCRKAGAWYATEMPSCYRPQTKFAKVMFLQMSVCPWGGNRRGGVHGGGACMVGGCAWQGGMCGGGHAWWGACMAGGMHGRGHAWWGGMCGGGVGWRAWQILRDTVNERAVRILLECLLVIFLLLQALLDLVCNEWIDEKKLLVITEHWCQWV